MRISGAPAHSGTFTQGDAVGKKRHHFQGLRPFVVRPRTLTKWPSRHTGV